MKKTILTILALISMLAVSTGTAFAAGTAVSLIAVRNDSAGPTFIFRVSGQFSNSELKGFVQVEGGDIYTLHCSQTDETTVVCHTSKKVGGSDVVVTFGGSKFWSYVPDARTTWCYKAYDWDISQPFPYGDWAQFATHCQDHPAGNQDSVRLYNPDFNNTYDYYFEPNGADWCPWQNPGAGYYYPVCFN